MEGWPAPLLLTPVCERGRGTGITEHPLNCLKSCCQPQVHSRSYSKHILLLLMCNERDTRCRPFIERGVTVGHCTPLEVEAPQKLKVTPGVNRQ